MRPRTGSSPLTRGKPFRTHDVQEIERLIPAHAGKTEAARDGAVGHWAHPRSRGENWHPASGRTAATGSSPLTRGKPCPHAHPSQRSRLIPAHAGKTLDCEGVGLVPGAHPRSRGENPPVRSALVADLGSSPLTRGKLGNGTIHGHGCGLIPAHAGKTSYRSSCS